MRSRLVATVLIALVTLPLLVPQARAQNALVVSVWGENSLMRSRRATLRSSA